MAAALAIVAASLAVAAMRSLRDAPPASPETRLDIVTPATSDPVSFALSPDGRQIVFAAGEGTPRLWDIWMLPLDGDRTPFPFLATRFDERRGTFSRDGRSVAYHSNESGRFEVYVRPFPGPGAPLQVSTAGGLYARWAYGGKEIFYLAPDGTLMAAPLTSTGTTIAVGRPVGLFRPRIFGGGSNVYSQRQYDVSRDGRFLINILLDDQAVAPITVLQNWSLEGTK